MTRALQNLLIVSLLIGLIAFTGACGDSEEVDENNIAENNDENNAENNDENNAENNDENNEENNDENNDENNTPSPDPTPDAAPEMEPEPVPDPGPAQCEDIEDRYQAVVSNANACREHADCNVLNGQCSVGLGGCYEFVNSSATQQELDDLGTEFSDADCTQAVCSCAPPPTSICQGGRCTEGPDCGGRQLGEVFPAEDECNECTCTPEGITCTERACDPCEGIELPDCPRECTQDDRAGQECARGDRCGNEIGDGCNCEDGRWSCFVHPPLGEGCNLVCRRGDMPPADTCEGIEAEYARLIISNRSCAGPQDCQVLDGQCGVGLGGCYEAVNMSVSQDELGQMGRRYNVIGCTEAVCDCAPPPSPDCQQGVCVFGR